MNFHFVTHEPAWSGFLQLYLAESQSCLLKEIEVYDGMITISVMDGQSFTARIEDCVFRYKLDKFDRMEIFVEGLINKVHFKEVPGMLKKKEWGKIKSFVLNQCNEGNDVAEVVTEPSNNEREDSNGEELIEKQADSDEYSNCCNAIIFILIIIVFLVYKLFFDFEEIPSIEGKWESDTPVAKVPIGEKDEFIQILYGEFDKCSTIYDFKSDGTYIAHCSYTYHVIDSIFVIVDLKYKTTITGTWKQDENEVTITEKDITWKCENSNIYRGEDFMELHAKSIAEKLDILNFEAECEEKGLQSLPTEVEKKQIVNEIQKEIDEHYFKPLIKKCPQKMIFSIEAYDENNNCITLVEDPKAWTGLREVRTLIKLDGEMKMIKSHVKGEKENGKWRYVPIRERAKSPKARKVRFR